MKIFSNFIKPDKFNIGLKELSNVDFTLFYDYRPTQLELKSSKINVLIINEPNEYFGNHDWAIENYKNFDIILTWGSKILNTCDNSLFLVYGESWLDDKHIFEPNTKIAKKREKNFSVSFLRGNKLQSIGHFIRHEIFSRKSEIKISTDFWTQLGNLNDFETMKDTKEDSFGKYQFSICVENNSREGYFTEKITDCILCKTIPIYYGCSNIDDFYNKDGIIQFQNADHAIKLINDLTPNYYNDRIQIIEENYRKAFEYRNYIDTIKNTLIYIFKENNLLS
jgi:hypothetical protein